MSEITRAAIGMPFSMAMESELSRRQFHSIAQALLAERDRLRAEVAGLRTGYEAYEQVNAELKAENETLIAAAQALRDEWRKDQVDAGRHRFARDCAYGALTLMEGKRVFVEMDYPSGEFSGCDQAYDAAIDAALGQGEQS